MDKDKHLSDEDVALMRKKKLEDYERWENSPEGIHYQTEIISACEDSEEAEEIVIVEVLSKLPKEVRQEVMGNVAFVVCNCSFVHWQPKGKAMIVLYFKDEHGDDRRTTVAHEIAHYWLAGGDPMKFGGDATLSADAEKTADDLCEKWGFGRAYENYDQFKK